MMYLIIIMYVSYFAVGLCSGHKARAHTHKFLIHFNYFHTVDQKMYINYFLPNIFRLY